MTRSPVVHFLVVGALAYATSVGFARSRDPRETLVVRRERLAELEADWRRMTGAPPSAAELADLVEREIDEEVSFREALRLGLDRGSSLARDRLASLMRFLGERDASDGELAREGRELGLERADLVIRRQLVEDVRARAVHEDDPRPATEAELAVAREALRKVRPARVAITHVFVDAARRGERAEDDAREIVAGLRSGAIDAVAARAAGDAFLHGFDFPPLSEREVASRFGRELANAVFAARPGEWIGPVRSAYGFHAVRIAPDAPPASSEAAASPDRLEREVRRERGEARYRARLAEWRSRYRVVVEERAG